VPLAKEEHTGAANMVVVGIEDAAVVRACGFGKDISRRSVSIAPHFPERGTD